MVKVKHFLWIGLALMCILNACQINQKQKFIEAWIAKSDTIHVQTAQHFRIYTQGETRMLVLSSGETYLLIKENADISEDLRSAVDEVIITPLQNVACFSTTHAAMINALGNAQTIIGLSGAEWISDSVLYERYKNGEIQEVGYAEAIDYDALIRSNTKTVILSAGTYNQQVKDKLRQLGIQVIANADYLEETLLGKAEWICFMAELYNQSADAQLFFNRLQLRYMALQALVKDVSSRPTVVCGLPWQGTWYMPANRTTTAALIHDAGGEYLFKDLEGTESQPLSIETVTSKAANADYWINIGQARTLTDILNVDERLKLMRAINDSTIYNNYAQIGRGGGNQVFEQGVLEPDKILKDLINILHPDLGTNEPLYYYMPIK